MAINNKINISLDAKDRASGKFRDLDKSASGLGKRLKGLGGPLKAAGIAVAAVGTAAGVAGFKMFNIAEGLEASMGKAKTVFGDYFGEMEKFAAETGKSMGLSRGEFLKTAAGIQDLLIPMGYTREAATGMTQDMMGLSGALAEWSAGQYTSAEVGDILAKAMLGEREQLKSLGIAISEEDVKQRLLAEGKAELTGESLKQARAEATLALITEKSTDAQTAYAENTDSLTRKKAEMTATLGNLKETIATALIPAFHSIVQTIQPIIEKVAENITLWFENKQNVEKLTTTLKAVIKVFGVVFSTLGKAIGLLFSLGEALGFGIFKVIEFTQAVRSKFEEFGNIISAKFNYIKDISMNVWGAIKSGIVGIADSIYSAVTGKFTAMIDKVSAIYNKIKGFLSSIFGAEKEANATAYRVQQTQQSIGPVAYSAPNFSGARANGGEVKAGHSYLVGERGSEMFTPAVDGVISPNGSSAGGVQINFGDVHISNGQTESQFFEKVKRTMIEVQRTSSLGF